jgi:TonB family protein
MLAILALSPVMLHAQVKSPAQPGSTPVLQSSNIQPVAFAAVKSLDSASVSSTPVRISTGVTPPVLVSSTGLHLDHLSPIRTGADRIVTVAMVVDRSGKPSNLKVVKSTDVFSDQGVLEAVSGYRFKPASLNGTAVPMEVTLNVDIKQ